MQIGDKYGCLTIVAPSYGVSDRVNWCIEICSIRYANGKGSGNQ